MSEPRAETKLLAVDAEKQFEIEQVTHALLRREIWFNRDVDERVVEFLIMQLAELDRTADTEAVPNAAGVVVMGPPPITVFVNSCGGSLYDGMAGFDAIVAARSRVTTVALGKCLSAGFLIFMGGNERVVHRNSVLMQHTPSMYDWGKLTDIKVDVDHVNGLMERDAQEMAARTNMSLDEWREICRAEGHGKDTYWTPEEAVERGIAHRIIQPGAGL